MNLESYKKHLERTINSYRVRTFRECFDCGELLIDIESSETKVCLLRHDIDFSPLNALAIAKVEAELGISSTFTVLLGGEFYNPLEAENRKILKEIEGLGHEVGLHFDAAAYEIECESELHRVIELEKQTLEDFIGVNVSMFSFHNTTQFTMNCKASAYGGITNAYAKILQETIDYTSDSNGYWRFRSWSEILDDDKKMIQVLTHPVWWGQGADLQPFERVFHSILNRAKSNIYKYIETFEGQSIRENKSFLSEEVAYPEGNNSGELLKHYIVCGGVLEELIKDRPNKELLQKLAKLYMDKQ